MSFCSWFLLEFLKQKVLQPYGLFHGGVDLSIHLCERDGSCTAWLLGHCTGRKNLETLLLPAPLPPSRAWCLGGHTVWMERRCWCSSGEQPRTGWWDYKVSARPWGRQPVCLARWCQWKKEWEGEERSFPCRCWEQAFLQLHHPRM